MAKTIDELAQPPIRRAILGGGTDEAVRTRPVRLRYGAVNLSWPLLSPQSGQWTEEAGQDDHAARFHACHLAWLMIQLLYESFNLTVKVSRQAPPARWLLLIHQIPPKPDYFR